MAKVAFVLNPSLRQSRHAVGDWVQTRLNGKTYHALRSRVYDLDVTKDRADYNAQLARLVNDPFVRNPAISGAFTLAVDADPTPFDLVTATPASTILEAVALLPHLFNAEELASIVAHVNGRLAATQEAQRVAANPVPATELQPPEATPPAPAAAPEPVAVPETVPPDAEPDELEDGDGEPESAPAAEPEPMVEDPPSGDLPPPAPAAAPVKPKGKGKKK